MSGLRRVASEWVCIEHGGFAGEKARDWWWKRTRNEPFPLSTDAALRWAEQLLTPSAIVVNESGKWPEIIKFEWEETHEPNRASRQAQLLPARA